MCRRSLHVSVALGILDSSNTFLSSVVIRGFRGRVKGLGEGDVQIMRFSGESCVHGKLRRCPAGQPSVSPCAVGDGGTCRRALGSRSALLLFAQKNLLVVGGWGCGWGWRQRRLCGG